MSGHYDEKAAAASLERRRHRERVFADGWSDGWQPGMLIDPDKAGRPEPPRVCGFLYDGRRHSISGEPESAKSMLAQIVALEFLRATPEDEDWKDGVAIIDFEGSREMVSNMLAELGATFDEVQRISYFQPTGPPTDQDIYCIAEALNVGLVIIDSAIGAYDASDLKDDGGRTDTERMGRLWVKPFFEYGVTTILLDHVTKDAKSRGRWSIGSERKLGKTDIALAVDTITPVSRGTTGLYKLIAGKDRGGYLKRGTTIAEIHLTSDPETHHVTWEFRKPAATETEGGWKPTLLMARVSKYVIDNPESSRSKIVDAVKGHSTEHKRMALDLLLEGGYLTETEGARGARLCTSLKPYTEPTPPPRLDPASTPPGGMGHDPASPPDPLQGAGRQAELTSDQGEADPASSNGHVNLTPDDREPLFEDGHLSPDEVERLAAVAREAGA